MDDLSKLPRPDGVYVIYSMDATCSDQRIDNMGPLNESRYWPESSPIGEWVQTEDNSEYSYDYLGREFETGNSVYRNAEDAEAHTVPEEVLDLPIGYGFEFSLDEADYYMKIGPSPYMHEEWLKVTGEQDWNESGSAEVWEVEVEEVETEDVPERPMGRHRKWVALLTFDQWQAFANNYCIDLHDNGMPKQYVDTMGSITEYGHLPAICVENTEGWGDNFGDPVIDSNFYCSFFTVPREYSNDRGAMQWDARERGAEALLADLGFADVFSI